MNHSFRIAGAFAALAVALTACSGSSSIPGTNAAEPVPGTAASATAPQNGYYALASPGAARPLCPPVAGVEAFRCFAWIRNDLHPMVNGDKVPSGIGYTPQEIESAYKLDVAKGAGQRVFIVDAYGYIKAAADLTHYRRAAKLSPCTTHNGCLQILNQNGDTSPLPPEPTGAQSGWIVEESLDVDAVSASCPKCGITLIQAQSSDNGDLNSAIEAATAKGATIVSMSWGEPEPHAYNGFVFPSGTVFVASAGDRGGGVKDGGGPQIPCTNASIVCVGGTALTHSGSKWSETVWNDLALDLCDGPCGATGSACSKIVTKPSWQTDSGCTMRSAADVSADAAVSTPLAIYNSERGGWLPVGGTSLAAPLIAGVFGLAGNAKTFGTGASAIWQNHASLNNVTAGTNVLRAITGRCASRVKYVCVAGNGFNGPTGWGSPNGSSDF